MMNHSKLNSDQEKLKQLRLQKKECKAKLIELSWNQKKRRD